MQIKVQQKFIKTSSRKIRQVLSAIKKLKPQDALNQLYFINKSASTKPIIELIKSGIAAAKNQDMEINDLSIKLIYCNEGPRMKRRFIGSRGRASQFAKQSSHLSLILEDSRKAQDKKKKKIIINKPTKHKIAKK